MISLYNIVVNYCNFVGSQNLISVKKRTRLTPVSKFDMRKSLLNSFHLILKIYENTLLIGNENRETLPEDLKSDGIVSLVDHFVNNDDVTAIKC